MISEVQAGAELCQAQAQFGLPAEAELMLSFMYVLPSDEKRGPNRTPIWAH